MMSPASAMNYSTQTSANLPILGSSLNDSAAGSVTSDDRPLNLSTGSRRTRSPPRSPLSPTAAFIYATAAAANASPTSQAFREPPTDPYLQALQQPHYHHPFPLNGQSAVELLQQVARKTQQRQAEGKGKCAEITISSKLIKT